MATLALVMIVRDEERTLARCLESVRGLVDEIVIADTGSVDASREIARSHGAAVYEYEWKGHFAEARNFALDRANSDWILVLDGDEYLDPEARGVIREFIASCENFSRRAIGRLRIVSAFQNSGEKSVVINYISRLFPADARYVGRIHEQIDSPLPRVNLMASVYHDGYDGEKKHDRNIPLLEAELIEHPGDSYLLYQLGREYRGMGDLQRSCQYMLEAYRRLDRRSRHAPLCIVDLVHILKELGRFEEGAAVLEAEKEYLADYPDFHFARGLFLLDMILSDAARYGSLLTEIERSYLTCIRLGETDKYDSVEGTGTYAAWYNLGVFYEVQGLRDKAAACYREASHYGHGPSVERLRMLAQSSKQNGML
jgi:glycosyltransferase involved in cell wall biosynthesis